MKDQGLFHETGKVIAEAVQTFFRPVIYLGQKIKEVWDEFTYRAGW